MWHRLLTTSLAISLVGAAVSCGAESSSEPTPTAEIATSSSSTTSVAPTTTNLAPSTTNTTTAPTSTTTTTIAPDPRSGRPYGVTTSQITFVDPTRPTPSTANLAAAEERTVEVWLTLPDTDVAVPLVVFSHGMSGHARKFEDLHRVWAEAGYAVAAPVFPLSNDGVEGSWGNLHDVPNQPGDVAFVLDELLALSADASSEYAGRFDPDRLGASGLSAGGFTTYEVAVDSERRDPRVDAAVVMSGLLNRNADLFSAADDFPVLIIHGDQDPLIGVEQAHIAYRSMSGPRYLIVLLGGGHASPYEDGPATFEEKIPGHDELIYASTVAFWDRYLLDIEEAEAELLKAATQDGLSAVRSDIG